MAKDQDSAKAGRAAGRGRLRARPASAPTDAWAGRAGEAGTLEWGGLRGALLYVPAGCRPDRPAPLALLLHGAGGDAAHGLGLLRAQADAAGLLLLAPASRRQTWDVILGDFGPDVGLIDRALGHVFARFAVDPSRLAVGGFSDGASYALSLGLTNGGLFSHVLAFSPGFMAPAEPQGRPTVFVSHGTRDETLPIALCSRRLVPALRHAGYDVEYREFDGPHVVPPGIAEQACHWFLGTGPGQGEAP